MHVTDIRERINWINGNKNEMNFSSEIKLVNILKKKKKKKLQENYWANLRWQGVN